MRKNMAKTKKNEEFDLDWSEVAKSFGAELLDELEPVKNWIDTGILALNYVCSGKYVGGGIPSGKVIEIFGDSASGKSLVGTNILKGTQVTGGVPMLLDAEHAISKDFAVQASKVDPKKFIVMEADTLEKAFSKIHNAIRTIRQDWKVPLEKPIIIIYDSIAASASEREFAETTIDMDTASDADIKAAGAGADKPGERAKICSKELRKLPAVLKKNNASVVFINQTRDKIGVMFGDPTAKAGGGRALEFYSSLCLRMRANRVPRDKEGNVLGVNVNVQNTKNRCFKPFVEAKNIYLFFEQGINPFGGLLQLLKQGSRISAKSAGNYIVNEPWAGGKEIKFKSSQERNDVPVDVLLQCPALVDAETPSQIEYYANLYGSAIETTDHGIADEEEVSESAIFGD